MACDVLVLDDDRTMLQMMVAVLRDEGFVVSQAASSEEAMRQFDTSAPPKVLVTDVNLRERKSGFDVTEELRVHAPGLPVVFITGRPDALGKRALDSHQRLLQKPFSLRTLVSTIQELNAAS